MTDALREASDEELSAMWDEASAEPWIQCESDQLRAFLRLAAARTALQEPAPVVAREQRMRDLEWAIVEIAFGMHKQPQHMIMRGLQLIDADRIRFALPNGRSLDVAAPQAPVEPAPVVQPAYRTFWVIERFADGKSAGYWDGGSSRNFVPDIDKAVQFCRQEDAAWVMVGWHWADVKITQHMMIPLRDPNSDPEDWATVPKAHAAAPSQLVEDARRMECAECGASLLCSHDPTHHIAKGVES